MLGDGDSATVSSQDVTLKTDKLDQNVPTEIATDDQPAAGNGSIITTLTTSGSGDAPTSCAKTCDGGDTDDVSKSSSDNWSTSGPESLNSSYEEFLDMFWPPDEKQLEEREKKRNEPDEVAAERAELMALDIDELRARMKAKELPVEGTKRHLVKYLMSDWYKKTLMTSAEVDKKLKDLGIEDVDKVNPCFKEGVRRGHVTLDGPDALDKVLAKGRCPDCGSRVKPKVREIIYHSHYGGSEYLFSNCEEIPTVPIKCPNQDCDESSMFVTCMCSGETFLDDSGKATNHCTLCPGFGTCTEDFRTVHCPECGEHYMAGRGRQYPCQRCYKGNYWQDLEKGVFAVE